MKRLAGGFLIGLAAVALLSAPAGAQAKPYFFLGGGLTKPFGDFNSYAKVGWLATGGIGANIGDGGLWVEAEGYYGSNKHSDVTGDKTNLIAGLAAVGYTFMPAKKASPYITGGAGFMSHQFKPATGASESESKFAYSGALGLHAQLGAKAGFWIEGRFLGAKDTQIGAGLAGFSINFGGN